MTPSDVDNSELINAMRRHAHGRQAAEGVFTALRDARLLVPGADDAAALPGTQEGARPIAIVAKPGGEQAIPAFTHEGAFREWDPEGGTYVVVRAVDLFALAVDGDLDAVLVNPGSPEGIQVGRSGMRKVLD